MEILFYISLSMILYTYFIYPLVLWVYVNLVTQKIKKAENKDKLPTISIIISVYNEEKIIKEKLNNCLNLNYPKDKLEILIGSDGSTDRTNEIISKYKDKIRFFSFNKRCGKPTIINKLVPKTKGQILVFSDATTIYKVDALKNIVTPFNRSDIGGVAGNLFFENPNNNPGGEGEKLYWKYEKMIKKLENRANSFISASGAIYAIRKKLFRFLPENIIADDFVISMSVILKGYRLFYQESAVAFEKTALSLKDEFKRRIRITTGNLQSLTLLKSLLGFRNIKVAFSFYSHKIFRWLIPFALIMLFISNAFIIDFKNIFKYIFLVQLLGYLVGLLGYFLNKKDIELGKLYVPYYFIAMNLGILLGFIRIIKNEQSVKWDKISRGE